MVKKDFKNNPAMSFISQETIDKVEAKTADSTFSSLKGRTKAPAGYKPNPEFIEKKSRRVQILITPSLHSESKAIADDLGISLNDFINRAIQEATYNSKVQDLIKKEVMKER